MLVNALGQCPLVNSNKGHTYLVESLAEHRARNNDLLATLPTAPSRPTEPAETAKRYLWNNFDRKTAKYNAHVEYNKQTIAIIARVFPTSIEGLKFNGQFHDNLKADTALQHVIDTAVDSIKSRKEYLKLSNALYA